MSTLPTLLMGYGTPLPFYTQLVEIRIWHKCSETEVLTTLTTNGVDICKTVSFSVSLLVTNSTPTNVSHKYDCLLLLTLHTLQL